MILNIVSHDIDNIDYFNYRYGVGVILRVELIRWKIWYWYLVVFASMWSVKTIKQFLLWIWIATFFYFSLLSQRGRGAMCVHHLTVVCATATSDMASNNHESDPSMPHFLNSPCCDFLQDAIEIQQQLMHLQPPTLLLRE